MATEALTPVRVIEAHRGWFDWRLRELWRSRELVGLFVWRDFVSIYRQTIIGPAWHVVRPLVTTFLFTLVFGRIARLSTDGAPPFLFYFTGTIAWMYFASALDNTAKTFVTHAPLFGKVSFPRLVMPLAIVISSLIAFAIQFCILLVAMAVYVLNGQPPHVTATVVLLPLLLAMLTGFALAGGIIVCALTTRYRDLGYAVSFVTQSLMYVTPVIFPVSSIPESYRWVALLNPLVPIFESLRLGLLGVGTVTAWQLVSSGLWLSALLLAGLLLFTRVERTFMDTV